MTHRWYAGLLFAVGLLTACTATITPPPPAPAIANPLPPRARDLSLNGWDPCAVLTPAQMAAMNVRLDGPLTSAVDNEPGCRWLHSPTEPVESYTVIDNGGYAGASYLDPTATPVITIAGFPAIQGRDVKFSEGTHCAVLVDIADDRNLQLDYHYNGGTPPTQDDACTKARTAATYAMETLLASTPG